MSHLFFYKVRRRLLAWTGDTGAYIRTTIKAMRLFGVPPEADWPYELSLLESEPDAYHYAYAQNFKGLHYARLDGYGTVQEAFTAPAMTSRGAVTLHALKTMLNAGYPVAFGMPAYSSMGDMGTLIGGHAMLAVGYDDRMQVPGQPPGAIIVRNSWGIEWGDHGYAYLPYWYVMEEFAVDWWTLQHADFVEISQFY